MSTWNFNENNENFTVENQINRPFLSSVKREN